MIRIYTTGRHAHRSPLSYPALRPLFADDIDVVSDPSAADILLFAHVVDIQEAPRAVVEDWRTRRRPVVLLSEEPFWDTIWGGEPLAHDMHIDTGFGALPVRQLNHHTSDIFDFERIPYYLLTHHRFANAYLQRFARNASRSPDTWRAALERSGVDVSFMFERRPEQYHDARWPLGDIIGLCSWRSELAQACAVGRIERLGRSWTGAPDRLTLATDWHLDKLVRLDGRARFIGALENTHQPAYVTEKFFDAFACGGVPVYFASPGHRVHTFGLPAESWVNLYGMSPAQAAAHLEDLIAQPAAAFAESLQAAQVVCRQLFEDPQTWQRERSRLRHAVITALRGVLDSPSRD